ncbi:MAG: DUF1453 family protein [Reyranella sp.]|uniref:hypothetical protein n=1 Tax=Reyranella sp. TaxID=1929291 RepID=UPI00121DF5AB|nr:hypothetical protein [Reyranella sp.]TAJ42141.1 MAG: DUF1453 family protein [Reyranella sp.]
MISKLTLLHIVLALMAAGGVYLAWREVRRLYISQWRLLVPPALGLGVALGLALIQIVSARQPGWTFVMALVLGLGAGVVRGSMMRIEHDLYRPKVVMSRAARFVLLWVAVLVAGATLVEILGARTVEALAPARYGAALVAMICAAAMQGRALALAVQLNRHYAHLRDEAAARAAPRPPVRPEIPPR